MFLDANILAPMPLCDTVLRMVQRDYFLAFWSENILAEVHRTLVGRFNKTLRQADRRIAFMRAAFEDAIVDGFSDLESAMTNDEKDRHVLAAAIRANADQIVTRNRRHFPRQSVEKYGIEIVSPDELLMNVWSLFGTDVLRLLELQAGAMKKETHDIASIARRISGDAPIFAKTIEQALTEGT